VFSNALSKQQNPHYKLTISLHPCYVVATNNQLVFERFIEYKFRNNHSIRDRRIFTYVEILEESTEYRKGHRGCALLSTWRQCNDDNTTVR
jgi:hypothetical protein